MDDQVDVEIRNEGTIWIFSPISDPAKQWVDEMIQIEDWQLIGDHGFAVDHRYARDLALGMQEAGFTLKEV